MELHRLSASRSLAKLELMAPKSCLMGSVIEQRLADKLSEKRVVTVNERGKWTSAM